LELCLERAAVLIMRIRIRCITIALLVSTLSLAAEEQEDSFLRSGMSQADHVLKFPTESSCNQAPDEETCYKTVDADSQEPCEWCVAGAIPSECMSQEQAAGLPEGVFECRTPGRILLEAHDKTFALQTKEHETSDLCDASSKSISGYMDIKGSKYDNDDQNKHLFFWMFEKRGTAHDSVDDSSEIPFVVWLTGGPGCSSTLALLTENGPCHVNKDGESTTVNPYSWTESAHVLWLDQPAGVGFSYGEEDDSNEDMVSEDAYWFLQAFFQKYPQYANNPLFIVGGASLPFAIKASCSADLNPGSVSSPFAFQNLTVDTTLQPLPIAFGGGTKNSTRKRLR